MTGVVRCLGDAMTGVVAAARVAGVDGERTPAPQLASEQEAG